MISSRELRYASSFPEQIPMPGEEYSKKVMDNLKSCLNIFKEKYNEKEFIIMQSNGEEIIFEVADINLCHMLGIDFQSLKSERFKKYRQKVLKIYTSNFNSYQLLEAILENGDEIIKLDNNEKVDCKVINYYKSQIKSEIFKKLDLENFSYILVDCNDEKNKIQKAICFQSNEVLCPYFIMGMIQTENIPMEYCQEYTITTLQALRRPQEIIENKQITIPTQTYITKNGKVNKIEATPEEKIKLLTMYKNIIYKYQIQENLNVTADYVDMLIKTKTKG